MTSKWAAREGGLGSGQVGPVVTKLDGPVVSKPTVNIHVSALLYAQLNKSRNAIRRRLLRCGKRGKIGNL